MFCLYNKRSNYSQIKEDAMAKKFEKWPKEIPRVGKIVQIVLDNGLTIETMVIARTTTVPNVYAVELAHSNIWLSINTLQEKHGMRQEQTDNGPLWKVIQKNGTVTTFTARVFPVEE
jgi:hypothetical protein